MNLSILSDTITKDLKLGLLPCAVVATFGSTPCGSIDDILGISEVCKPHNIYIHVDGAYGGSHLLLKRFRRLATINKIDSININPNKCLGVTLSCSCMWMLDRRILLRVQPNTLYLDYKEKLSNSRIHTACGLSLSRPFRSLKLFFILMLNGTEKLKSDLNTRYLLANRIFQNFKNIFPNICVTKPTDLPIFCFRLETDTQTLLLLRTLNDTRQISLTPTILDDTFIHIRLSINNPITKEYFNTLFDLLKQHIMPILSNSDPLSLLVKNESEHKLLELKTLSDLLPERPDYSVSQPGNWKGVLHLAFGGFSTAYGYLTRLVSASGYFSFPNIKYIYYSGGKFLVVFDIDSDKVRRLRNTDKVIQRLSSPQKCETLVDPILFDNYIISDSIPVLLPREIKRSK